VLASLAIPRFTQMSVKAKAAEAPRVLASYESAALSAAAEGGDMSDLIFDLPDATESKWWKYTKYGTTSSGSAMAEASNFMTGTLTVTVMAAGTISRTYDNTEFKKLIPNFKVN